MQLTIEKKIESIWEFKMNEILILSTAKWISAGKDRCVYLNCVALHNVVYIPFQSNVWKPDKQ